MSDLPPPPRAYRGSAILHAVLALVILVIAALTGGGLLRALLVRAQLAAPLCARCGLKYEREFLGERVCRCERS